MVRQLFIPVLLFSCLITTAVSQASIARKDCQSQCGNISIPFPFGIGKGCYIDDWFEVVCTERTTGGRPIPVLRRIDLDIIRIDLYDGTLDVQFPITFWNCGDKKTQKNVSLVRSPFAFSEQKNKFIAVGCELHATISSELDSHKPIVAGCSSVCANNVTVDTGCHGVKCCKISIPPKLQVFHPHLKIDPSTPGQQNCRYAFLVKETWLSQSGTNLSALPEMPGVPNVSVALNWGLDSSKQNDLPKPIESFPGYSHKKKNKSTGYCHNSSDTSLASPLGQSGQIVCYCEGGYEGNPYLVNGCVDINECDVGDSKSPCGKYAKCVNTKGRHKCKPKNKNLTVPLGIVSGIAAALLPFGSRDLYRTARGLRKIIRRKNFFKLHGGQLLKQLLSEEGAGEEMTLFDSGELERATDGFATDRVLGPGEQDTVYKGMMENGNVVAIKKSEAVDESEVEEFIREVVKLAKFTHRNVVRLLGCCLETEEPLLVYEYVPNGTLSQYLCDEQEEFPLTWVIRLRIATDIAGALSDLHSSASFSAYHRDINSTNILLDGKYRAKLAGVGTPRSAAIRQTDSTTAEHDTVGLADVETSVLDAIDQTDSTTVEHDTVGLTDIETSRPDAIDQTDSTTVEHDTVGLTDIETSRPDAIDQTDSTTAEHGTVGLTDNGTSRSDIINQTDSTTTKQGMVGLADNGTSRSDAIDQRDSTTAEHGTTGELNPKDTQSRQFAEKSDVYNFGVVLVELLIGQKLVSIQKSKQGRSLATYFIQCIEKRRLFEIVDARVKKEGKRRSIIEFAKLAKRCLISNAKKRPAMKEVAAVLENIRESEKPSDADEQRYEEDETFTSLTSAIDDLTGSLF